MTDSPPADFTLDVCMVCGGAAQRISDMGYSCAGGVCGTCYDAGLVVTKCAMCDAMLPIFYYYKPGILRVCAKCRINKASVTN